MSKAMELADKLELMERSGLWYESKDAAAELRRLAAVEKELAAIRALEPNFWVRWRSDGMYEGPIHDAQIEQCRKDGGWSPLYALPEQK